MFRILSFFFALLALAACESGGDGSGGGGIPRFGDATEVRFRHVDSVNALRASRGLNEVALNASLSAAAATHARDMAVQKRAWHFGSDRSSPITRAVRSGYGGRVLAENISESFDDEFEVIQQWMSDPQARAAMMNPTATNLGIGWFQEQSGKVWWVQIVWGAELSGRLLRAYLFEAISSLWPLIHETTLQIATEPA